MTANAITIEIGTTRPLGTVGRDVFTAAQAAYLRGEAAELAMGGQVIAAVVPAGPTSPLAAALADVDDAQASARAQLPDGTLGSFPTNRERIALRELANAVRVQLGRVQTGTS